MKRLRIYLTSFTLIQQFLTIVCLTAIFLVFFAFSFLNRNIDYFVNNQMYEYIHRSQSQYVQTHNINEESNVVHFVYNANSRKYLNYISKEYTFVLPNINPNIDTDLRDGTINIDDVSYVYSVRKFDESFRLVSIVKNAFKEEFKNALLNSVIYVMFYVIGGLLVLILAWIVSLIRPINRIINYINDIKAGNKANLSLSRHDEIGEMAEALIEMNDKLSEQQSIRDEMIQNISHDLKTPIATIKSYSESIKDGIYPYGSLDTSVDVIYENAQRLEKKVYSLIYYNKMGYLKDTNEGVLNLEMAPVISKAIMAMDLLKNDINIETNFDNNIYFHGEEEPWRVLVENLLDNSLRYAKSKVTINLSEGLLEVINDGEKIDEDKLGQLFKPYEKGNKGKFGLGLSIVKKVAETYGYNVTGENMADGVIFRVYAIKDMVRPSKKRNTKKGIIE